MSRCKFSGFMGLLLTVYLSGIAVVCGILTWPTLLDWVPLKFAAMLASSSMFAGVVLMFPLLYKSIPPLDSAIRKRAWKTIAKQCPDVFLQMSLGICPGFVVTHSYVYAHNFGLVPFLSVLVLFLGLGFYRQTVVGCFSGEKTCA